MNQPWIYMCSPSQSPLPPPSLSQPSGSSQCTSPEHLSHASSLGWWSVSPLIVYLFQCCSLRTSHSCLLPQSLKVCSVHLCLFLYKIEISSHWKTCWVWGGKTRINIADFEKMKFQAILKPMEMLKWQSLRPKSSTHNNSLISPQVPPIIPHLCFGKTSPRKKMVKYPSFSSV